MLDIRISDNKILKKNSITSKNYPVTYYQTLEVVPWLLSQEKSKK